MTLVLRGFVPSKKNNYRSSPSGGVYHNTEVRDQIASLVTQAKIVWKRINGGVFVLDHPNLRIQFYVKNRRADRDNKLSTILDVLQEAGVLRNDNVAHCNGTLVLLPSVVGDEERVVIEFL